MLIHYPDYGIPPGGLHWLFPLPFGINLVTLLHILAGGYGFYMLIKQWGYSEYLAILGAGSFLLLPKTYAHFAAGHITYLYAFTLTPWLMLLGSRKIRKDWFWEIILIAGMILADVRWVPFGIAAWVVAISQRAPLPSPMVHNIVKSAIKKIGVVIAAISLSAVLIIPFTQFASLSTRSLMTPGENLIYSLPFNKLLNIIFPSYGGSAEWMVYCGAGLFLLACISLINIKSRRIWINWIALDIVHPVVAGIKHPGTTNPGRVAWDQHAAGASQSDVPGEHPADLFGHRWAKPYHSDGKSTKKTHPIDLHGGRIIFDPHHWRNSEDVWFTSRQLHPWNHRSADHLGTH